MGWNWLNLQTFNQVVPIRLAICTRSPKAMADLIPYKYRVSMLVLIISFKSKNSVKYRERIETKKKKERDNPIKRKADRGGVYFPTRVIV